MTPASISHIFSRKKCLKYCHKIVCESGPRLIFESRLLLEVLRVASDIDLVHSRGPINKKKVLSRVLCVT